MDSRSISGQLASSPRAYTPNPAAQAASIGAQAEYCLHLELATWPKPGLVSHVDHGSHADMNAAIFSRSARALRPYFTELAAAGGRGSDMRELRSIGLAAEAAMRAATAGVNTHRGAIFGLGLLCAAAGARFAHPFSGPQLRLGEMVTQYWGQSILAAPCRLDSHGGRACRAYGAGGARWQAAAGFPAAYEIGLPALRQANTLAPDDPEAQRVHACFALIATLDDTNLLHRGGPTGLAYARQAAAGFLARGSIGRPGWRDDAAAIHRAFVARNLSPGGCADLLAISLFLQNLETETAPVHERHAPAYSKTPSKM